MWVDWQDLVGFPMGKHQAAHQSAGAMCAADQTPAESKGNAFSTSSFFRLQHCMLQHSKGLNSLTRPQQPLSTSKRIGDGPDFAVHLVLKVEQLYF